MSYLNLLALHSSNSKSSDSSGIGIEITKGREFHTSSYLEGSLLNFERASVDLAYSDYAEAECYEGGGIWTTAIRTSVSRTVGTLTSYWVPGYLDTEGMLWNVDVGVICQSTGEISLREQNLSLSAYYRFQSSVLLPPGIKVAILKKVTFDQVEEVARAYGDYRNPDRLTRTESQSALQFNASDQKVDLEDLSLGLLSLLRSNYKPEETNTTYFGLKGFSIPSLKSLVEDNFDRLSRLTDLESSSLRAGSIPYQLTTYLEPELIYGSNADELYLNPQVRVVEEGYSDEDCFSISSAILSPSRAVKTRSLGWLILCLLEYTIQFNTLKYAPTLRILASYLINQVDGNLHLVSEGWTHANQLSDSVEVREFRFSTNVISFLALTRLYEWNEDPLFLEFAALIQKSIRARLVTSDHRFLHAVSTEEESTESLIYGAIFAKSIGRLDWLEAALNRIQKKLVSPFDGTFSRYKQQSGSLIPDGSGGYEYEFVNRLTTQSVTADPSLLSLLTLSSLDNSDRLSVLKLNLLLIELLKGESVPVKSQEFLQWVSFHSEFTSMAVYSYELSNTLLDFKLASLNVLNQKSFEKKRIFDRLFNLLQVRPDTLYKQDLAFSLADVLSGLFVKLYQRKRRWGLKSLSRTQLIERAKELNLPLLDQESDEELADRIRSYLMADYEAVTREGIVAFLNSLGINSEIEEPWKHIQTFNTFEFSVGTSGIGRGYFPGSIYAPGTFDLIIKQPLPPLLKDLQLGSSGSQVRLIQQISILSETLNPDQSDPHITYIGGLLLENGGPLLLENLEGISSE